jgi:hypothetical protein
VKEWKIIYKEDLHYLYISPGIVWVFFCRRLLWAGDVAKIAKTRNAYRTLVKKSYGKQLLGRSRRRWRNNIKTHVRI